MTYVSCRYGPPPDETMPGAQQMIICVDEEGTEWWVPGEDCQVGDWLRFVEEGNEVTPYEEPEEPSAD
jgi:hypothetical protein